MNKKLHCYCFSMARYEGLNAPLICSFLLFIYKEAQLMTSTMFQWQSEKWDLLYKSSARCKQMFCCLMTNISTAFLKKKNPCIFCSKLTCRCLSWKSLCGPWTADTYRLLMNTACRAAVISAADKCPAGELAKFKDKSSNLRPDECVVWVGVELLLMSGYLFWALLTEIWPTDDWNPSF